MTRYRSAPVFAPCMSRNAAVLAIRAAGYVARPDMQGLGIFNPRSAVMLAHAADNAAAVMLALALRQDRDAGRLCLGRDYSDAAAAAVVMECGSCEYGFTGPDWEPTAATRFYCQRGDSFGMGETPAAALGAMLAAETAARDKANGAAACESFLAAHAEPLPAALTVESAEAAAPTWCSDPRASAISPRDTFATFYTAEGLALATYSRPPYVGDSGPFRGLYRLALTDGRVVAASRLVLTVRGVRKALADYAAATGQGPDADETRASDPADLLELARQNFRRAAEELDSTFRASNVGRAARLARRAALTVPALPAAVPAELNGSPVKAAADHGNGVFTVRVALADNPVTPFVVASYWPALGRAWSWGHYCTTAAEADSAFAEVSARNARRATGEEPRHAGPVREELTPFRPMPCQQQQARHTPAADSISAAIQRGIDARHGGPAFHAAPLTVQAAAWGPSLAPQVRVWGVAVVPAAEFALAPVPRVDGRAVWQAIRDARKADAAALGRGAF